MSSSLGEKGYKIVQEYYIIVVGFFKIAAIFTGLGFYGIAKVQQYL